MPHKSVSSSLYNMLHSPISKKPHDWVVSNYVFYSNIQGSTPSEDQLFRPILFVVFVSPSPVTYQDMLKYAVINSSESFHKIILSFYAT
jgi:hypothetical protein